MMQQSPPPLPKLALSVRQPWAWAIVFAGKDIENRTRWSIEKGGMTPGSIAIHAASGMSESEYLWAICKLHQLGIAAPRPDMLVRGALIGTVEVLDIVESSGSRWFGGPCGLVLSRPVAMAPIAVKGERGYFRWRPAGTIATPKRWMLDHDPTAGTPATLFPGLGPSFRRMPRRPVQRDARTGRGGKS